MASDDTRVSERAEHVICLHRMTVAQEHEVPSTKRTMRIRRRRHSG